MDKIKTLMFVATLFAGLFLLSACGQSEQVELKANVELLSGEAKECVDCHSTETHGIVQDWDSSRHAQEGVSCLDCHEAEAETDIVLKNVEGHEDITTPLSVLVPPSQCAECHEQQVAEFDHSGHHRAALQYLAKESMQSLIHVHEGQNHPTLHAASDETGCMQCHGTMLVVDDDGKPTENTYPSSGIGNVYPNGEIGNCTVCHTRHKFDIAEARKPEACAACHLGPDHPDIEIYQNSKHGQIYYAEGTDWTWDSASNEWEPGAFRAPTCAVCHISGVGDLQMTHNVSQRLYWNLWDTTSKMRNSDDPMSPLFGDGEAGREDMRAVCSNCHATTFIDGYFASADKAVHLYNEAYFPVADKMYQDLKAKDLLGENPWADEFQTTYYFLWHHEGRRARQGALMGAPDWAHWHGFFELQLDMYELEEIYADRIATGEIE